MYKQTFLWPLFICLKSDDGIGIITTAAEQKKKITVTKVELQANQYNIRLPTKASTEQSLL